VTGKVQAGELALRRPEQLAGGKALLHGGERVGLRLGTAEETHVHLHSPLAAVPALELCFRALVKACLVRRIRLRGRLRFQILTRG
jgi:hypothetical protein